MVSCRVSSSKLDGTFYQVLIFNKNDAWYIRCDCPGYRFRRTSNPISCRHIKAVRTAIQSGVTEIIPERKI